MSRPLASAPLAPGGHDISLSQSTPRPRKISTACSACQQRKTRCSGGTPCDACTTRGSQCIYDVTADQRRKIANQRNVQELANIQSELDKHRQLLGGLIATIRAGDIQATQDLISLIQSGIDLSQLAAHVRNECRSSIEIQQAYDSIDFVIDDERTLPSPTQILNRNLDSATEMYPSQRYIPHQGSIDPNISNPLY